MMDDEPLGGKDWGEEKRSRGILPNQGLLPFLSRVHEMGNNGWNER